MTRYKLPEVLGGGEVEADETWSGCAGAQPEYRIGDVTLTMPRGTPMEPVDTTPAEPEPGAWDLDGVLCVRDPSDVAQRWFWCIPDEGRSAWTTWKLLWSKHGGPGITPRRLVPEPEPVELPWTGEDFAECKHEVYVIGDMVREALAGDDHSWLPDQAEAKGWALISAARAAREVTP